MFYLERSVTLLRVKHGGLCVYLQRSVMDCAFTYSEAWWTVSLLRVKRDGLCVYLE